MNCPQCGAKVAQGEAICPKCDFILDSSFLGGAETPPEADDEPTGGGEPPPSERTNIGAPPPARPGTGTRPSVRGNSGARPAAVKSGSHTIPKSGSHTIPKSGANPMPKTGGPSGPNKPVRSTGLVARPAGMQEPETEAATNVVPPKPTATSSQRAATRPPPQRAPAPPPPEEDEEEYDEPPPEEEIETGRAPRVGSGPGPQRTFSSQVLAPDQALDDFKSFVTLLPVGDKVAFVCAALTILTTFLPWKDTAAEGEILGLMSLGIVVFLVMIAVLASIVVRVRRVMPQLNPLVPWLVQLGGTVFAALWCIVYIGLSIDARKTQALVGNFEVSVSSPSFGVFLALFACAGTAAGTLMGLKARPT